MGSSLTIRERQDLDREENLARLAEVAKQAHAQVLDAAREAVVRALEAGRALIQARQLCRKGAWTAWLTGHFGQSCSSAYDYMRLARYVAALGDDAQCLAGLSYNDAKRLIAGKYRAAKAVRGEPSASDKPLAISAPTALMRPATPDQPRATEVADTAVPAGASEGDPLDRFVRLLDQAVAELHRVVEEVADHASYARHLLPMLEELRGGVGARAWFDEVKKRSER